MRSRFVAFGLLCSLLALVGCGKGSSEIPKTAPTSGTVTVKTKAVAGVRVTLHPQFDMGALKYQPTGETDKAGKFVIRTGPNEGAPPGEYVVTFDKPRTATEKKTGLETEVDDLGAKYSDPAKSQWKVQIKDGDNTIGPYALD